MLNKKILIFIFLLTPTMTEAAIPTLPPVQEQACTYKGSNNSGYGVSYYSPLSTVENCASQSTTYIKFYDERIVGDTKDDYYKVDSCESCKEGAYYMKQESTEHCDKRFYYYTCSICTKCDTCVSEDWTNSSPGYQYKTNASCNESTCTCTKTTSYRCASNYYGTSTNGSTGCSACPDNGKSDPGSETIDSCYKSSGTQFSDTYGNFYYTETCHYNE